MLFYNIIIFTTSDEDPLVLDAECTVSFTSSTFFMMTGLLMLN